MVFRRWTPFTRVIAITLVCLANQPLAAQVKYLSVALSDLLEDTELAELARRIPWFHPPQERSALRPYAILDGAGEAYVRIDWGPWIGNNVYDDAVVAVRLDAPREVAGKLYLPGTEEQGGMTAHAFTIPSSATTESARDTFHQAKASTYSDLLERNVPGAAWFRHQLRETRKQLPAERKPTDDATRRRAFQPRPSDLEDTFLLFSGGRAISENLQLDRALLLGDDGDSKPVDLESVRGISIAEIDWKPLVKGLSPKLDQLAKNIPHDQHALFFPSFEALVTVIDEATRSGRPILDMLEPRSEDARTQARYEQQLTLEANALARQLGPHIVQRVAITGSDPYIRLGSDVAILFKAKNPKLLVTYLSAKRTQVLEATPEAKELSGELHGVPYRAVVSPDRTVSSYVAELDDVIVVTNSATQLERIVATTNEKATSLASLPEYKFFRDRYKIDEKDETAFIMLTDATIRRWCGPKWRIADSRRVRAAAILSELQAAHLQTWTQPDAKPTLIESSLRFPGGEVVGLTASSRGVHSSVYGSLDFLTPIAELELHEATTAEVAAYERWRTQYQRNWRQFFDPIAIRLTVAKTRLAADVTVMPLIAQSDYNELIEVTRGVTIDPNAGDPHPESIFHVVLAIDPDSDPVREIGNFALTAAPGLRQPNPLSWLGKSVAVYADEDSLWKDAFLAEDPMEFLEENIHRLPVAIRAEVAHPLKAAAFLSSVRAFIEQTAPGMTQWSVQEYEGQKYVRVSPASSAPIPGEFRELAIYYAVTPRAITLTLSKAVLERTLRREIAQRQESSNAESETASPAVGKTAPTAPELSGAEVRRVQEWLGGSLSLRATKSAARIVEAFSNREYESRLRARSWANLPILNEWRRLYPDSDPLDQHERLWGIRLRCPGGGRYVWNEAARTMESTVFGHPGRSKRAAQISWPIQSYTLGEFGLTFEEQGLRTRVELKRVSEN